jgi:hypothetical protein
MRACPVTSHQASRARSTNSLEKTQPLKHLRARAMCGVNKGYHLGRRHLLYTKVGVRARTSMARFDAMQPRCPIVLSDVH